MEVPIVSAFATEDPISRYNFKYARGLTWDGTNVGELQDAILKRAQTNTSWLSFGIPADSDFCVEIYELESPSAFVAKTRTDKKRVYQVIDSDYLSNNCGPLVHQDSFKEKAVVAIVYVTPRRHIDIVLAFSDGGHPRSYNYVMNCAWGVYKQRTIGSLRDLVLEHAQELKSNTSIVPEGSILNASIYKLYSPLVSAEDGIAKKEAYRAVNDTDIESKAEPLSLDTMTENIDPGKLLAVVSVQRPDTLPGLAREDIATVARSRASPSAGAKASERIKTQTSQRIDAVHNFRPLSLSSPLVTIYHPVFAKFLKLMTEPQDFTHEELSHAFDFVCCASEYYRNEGDRIRNISHFMQQSVHTGILSRSDGTIVSAQTPVGFFTVTTVHNIKNEIGEGSSDPMAQAECGYVAIYSSDEARSVRRVCCCPAFLIGMAGPYIIVNGAVFADRFISNHLTQYISIVPVASIASSNKRSPIDDAVYRVAQLFRALRLSILDLDTFYHEVVASMAPTSITKTSAIGRSASTTATLQHTTFWPHFNTFDNGNEKVTLEYKNRLEPDFRSRAVFLADAKCGSRTDRVVVKFAYAYSREGHELLSNATPAQAPKLWHCAYVPEVGTWVVVMEYIQATALPETPRAAIVTSLRTALKKLHDAGLVFGDLRWPNVLIVKDEAILIDFDWCGERGKARYPSDIYMEEEGMWHETVHRGGLILKEHDAYHFRALTHEDL